MAVPPYFATAFLKSVILNITDVNQIITAIRTALTVTLPVGSQWAESPAGTFTSPADPVSGFTMQLVLTRNAALQLFATVNDQNTVAMAKAGVSPDSGTNAAFYAGPTHFWLQVNSDSSTGHQPSWVAGVIVDPTPEAKNASNVVVMAKFIVNASFATTNTQLPDLWLAFDAGGNVPNNGGTAGKAGGPTWSAGNGLTLRMVTAGGTELAVPVVGNIQSVAGTFQHLRQSGIFPQFFWVDKNHLLGALVTVPIDIGVTATFDVIGNSGSFQMNNNGACVLAVRSG